MDNRAKMARLLDQAEDVVSAYVKALPRDTKEPDYERKDKLGRSIARVVRRRLAKQLERLYFQLRMAYPQRGTKAIGDVIDFDALFEDDPEEAQELIAMILQGAQGGMDLVKLQTRLQLDYGLTNAEAATWARRYSYELIKDIDKTTRDVIRSAVTDFIKDPDYTMADLFDLLEPQFGRVRAERIAVTEVTRAYSQGQQMARETLKEQFPGVTVVDRWFTNNDDLVCPVCGPLDGEEREQGEVFYQPEDAYQDGYPPRHPNCRCWINTTTRVGKSVKYSDDQPRDEAGRWTDGGGSSGGTDPTAITQYADVGRTGKPIVDQPAYRYGDTSGDVVFYSRDVDYAEEYAIERGGKPQDVREHSITLKKPLVVNAPPREFSSPDFENPIIRGAIQNGYDSVVFTDKVNDFEFYVILKGDS